MLLTLDELKSIHPHELVRKPEECVKSDVRFVRLFENLWFGSPINFGANEKLDKSCSRSSLLAGTTCPPSCTDKCNPHACYHHGCYAVQNENLRPNVWNKDLVYTLMATNDIPRLERLTLESFNKRPRYVTSHRINERGDIPSQEYLDMWSRIIPQVPLTFYLYTRWRDSNGESVYDWSNYDKAGGIWHPSEINGHTNFGPLEYIQDLHSTYRADTYICPFYMTKQPCGICEGSCNLCMTARLNGKTPLFEAHGAAVKLTKGWTYDKK